jgi:hypothetical protein
LLFCKQVRHPGLIFQNDLLDKPLKFMIFHFRMTKSAAALIIPVAGWLAGSQPALALDAAYVLQGVTFTATSVNGSPVVPPFTPPKAPMTGLFVWHYTAGDFANGSGTFIGLTIPWTFYGLGPGLNSSNGYGQSMSYSIDNTSLNGTLAGPSVHSQGIDFMVSLTPTLSSPSQTVAVNASGSSFDIWGWDGSEYTGTVTGGNIVPYQPLLSVRLDGTNIVCSWPTNNTDGFLLRTASSLKANQWETSAVPVVVIGTDHVATIHLAAGNNAFFRLGR